jgi:hypothetical protein
MGRDIGPFRIELILTWGTTHVNFYIPKDLADYLVELDEFIEKVIKPRENADDNICFVDHQREHARTAWDRGKRLVTSVLTG